MAMASSGTQFITSDEISNSDKSESIAPGPHACDNAQFQSSTNLKRFKGSHLKGFHSTLFVGDSIWICGWNKNIFGQNTLVFLNVQYFFFDVVFKNKFKYPGADQPLIMFTARDRIFFVERDGKEVHSFNTKTHEFHRVFRPSDHTISAMCGNNDCMYILDKNRADRLLILDSSFNYEGYIATGLWNIKQCNVTMCSLNHNIVLANSFPFGCIRCLNREHGIIWLFESQLMKFNPVSMSAIPGGGVIFADGDIHQVSTRNKKKELDP